MAPAPTAFQWSDVANVVDSLDEEEGRPLSALEELYFNGSKLGEYEPCVDALQKLLETEGDDDEDWNDFEKHFDQFMDFNWCSRWDGKKYDLVFYGVSGYTGYLVMQYLKRVAFEKNPEEFTVAFAGRTVSKVVEMRDRNFAGTKWADIPVLQASYDDVVSVIDLARSAHVIVNVAGPYSLAQGEVLIDACCHCGTHYCDVSGEIPWSLRTLDLHNHAVQGGALIAPSSAVAGSYPDMLVFLAAKKAREDWGEELAYACNYATGGGASAGSSGGTLASRGAMSLASDEAKRKMADPFALGGFIPLHDRNGVKETLIEQGTGRCTAKGRKEDQDSVLSKVGQCPYTGVFRAPTIYSYFNTRITRRTNALLADLEGQPYGRKLVFHEFALLPPEAVAAMQMATLAKKGGGGGGPAKPAVGDGGAGGGSKVDSEKEALEAQGKYYAQGEGPPLEELGDAWLANFGYARTTSGKEVRCCMCGGDGYFETARCAVEWALTARFDYDKLPHKGGVLTAMAAGQHYYAQRLLNSGLKFRMGGWFKPEELGPPGFGSSS